MSGIEIIRCNFDIPLHCNAVVKLMKAYMTDVMGGRQPLDNAGNKNLISGLKNHPAAFTLLAKYGTNFVGLTNSFINFSTFDARNFLNIHDLIVLTSYRGKGIGKLLLEKNIRIAEEELGCSKITLEVRNDNTLAKALYKSLGFKDTTPPMHFWFRPLPTDSRE
ncbi:MAG TPA: GNAT family N-acetyltransferase [Bacteroidales bacterium]|nr:GNAT family N-acetyltransferase [Bacteroidales bacterium]